MKKAYINLPDNKSAASTYQIEIEYDNGEIKKDEIIQYSYSNVFEVIKERHEGEHDRKVKSIKIDFMY
ncbi:hypothetical protein [Clostridium saccharoperbutylacetonicum]|uniref:hypothetical protein n=1 Tax=Clostridium saccharoperbutylacetonicum TaxID=36745 RepID=UPI000983DAC4|nr:hypothetical protein [Clostridium saccharoperbutylacetonicum]AQR95544.1 hypothetical protein CLSAP_28600 [Clostridium saccharoperbutylacetonicum]NSB31404.1 hypothetical protein [Clostridium saccharoperbutylacetonicum]